MRRTETVTFTNMCMLCDENKVLVQDKRDEDWKGITFPGGHVEPAESFTDAVIREVFEETGLKISSPSLCGIKDWTDENGRYVVLLYKATRFEGTLKSSDEGEVFWADIEKLCTMPLVKGMDKMLEVFTTETLSEDYFYQENGIWVEELK